MKNPLYGSHILYLDVYVWLFWVFFSKKKTPSISYKILQMSYVQIPVGMR